MSNLYRKSLCVCRCMCVCMSVCLYVYSVVYNAMYCQCCTVISLMLIAVNNETDMKMRAHSVALIQTIIIFLAYKHEFYLWFFLFTSSIMISYSVLPIYTGFEFNLTSCIYSFRNFVYNLFWILYL